MIRAKTKGSVPVVDEGPGQQSATSIQVANPLGMLRTVYSFNDLYVVPIGQTAPPIEWPDLQSDWGAVESNLGEGFGYRWYGHGNLFFLASVSRNLKLLKGEGTIPLLIRGLGIRDEGSMTRNTAIGFLARLKDEALPALHREALHGNAERRWGALSAIGQIRTPKGEKVLGSLYQNKDPELRKQVMWSVVQAPYMKSLKPIYQDAIQNPDRLVNVASAALEFGWKDLVPAIHEQSAKVRSVWEVRSIHESLDQMGPHKLDGYLRFRTLTSPNKEQVAGFLACPDQTYIALVALEKLQPTKGYVEREKLGLQMFDCLPASLTEPLVERFSMAKIIERLRRYGSP